MSRQTSDLNELVDQIENPALKRKAQRLLGQRGSFRGYVARTDSRGNVGWIPWQQATAQGPTGTDQNILTSKKYNARVNARFAEKTPIQKRTERERVESLATRFWKQIQADPNMAPIILKEMHEEYWKAGRPVSYDDMKAAAIQLLRKAAEEAARTKGK